VNLLRSVIGPLDIKPLPELSGAGQHSTKCALEPAQRPFYGLFKRNAGASAQ
jgi:hypothetical protein